MKLPEIADFETPKMEGEDFPYGTPVAIVLYRRRILGVILSPICVEGMYKIKSILYGDLGCHSKFFHEVTDEEKKSIEEKIKLPRISQNLTACNEERVA